MVYDVDDPHEPEFVDVRQPGARGRQAPEGVLFIDRRRQPHHTPLVVVANEVSGTTAIYEISSIEAGMRTSSR